MVVGFLGEAAWQSTPKRSKTIAAQRLSSTLAAANVPVTSRLHSEPMSGASLTVDVGPCDERVLGSNRVLFDYGELLAFFPGVPLIGALGRSLFQNY